MLKLLIKIGFNAGKGRIGEEIMAQGERGKSICYLGSHYDFNIEANMRERKQKFLKTCF